MSLNCGIVGLPNVGKSTLFNAITNTNNAQAANYPFCTIEPNVGRVVVPDERLDKLAAIALSQKIIPNFLDIVDIAGLVRGASKGEGLGNQFLSHIRNVDAIIHIVRCFDDGNVVHVENSVDPIRDIEIIETELLLADMEVLEKRLTTLEKKIKARDKDALAESIVVNKLLDKVKDGIPARTVELTPEESYIVKSLHLITKKPILFVANVSENEVGDGNDYSDKVAKYASSQNANTIIISAKLESDMSGMSEEERLEFLKELGISETGLSKVIRSGYSLLNLITFFTIGPKEAHAWTVGSNALAPEAAGVIHTDFAKGFIRAETISFNDYVQYNGENGAKEAGRMRLEGKEYKVQDGDIFHFRFNT